MAKPHIYPAHRLYNFVDYFLTILSHIVLIIFYTEDLQNSGWYCFGVVSLLFFSWWSQFWPLRKQCWFVVRYPSCCWWVWICQYFEHPPQWYISFYYPYIIICIINAIIKSHKSGITNIFWFWATFHHNPPNLFLKPEIGNLLHNLIPL